jgi:hypothetical protein
MLTSTESISISSGALTPNRLSSLPGASLNDLKRLPTVVSVDSVTVVSASFLAAAAHLFLAIVLLEIRYSSHKHLNI